MEVPTDAGIRKLAQEIEGGTLSAQSAIRAILNNNPSPAVALNIFARLLDESLPDVADELKAAAKRAATQP